MPKNTEYIQMIAKPVGAVGIAMYTCNANGAEVAMGAPVAKGNDVYQLAITPSTEDTLWAVNLKGDTGVTFGY